MATLHHETPRLTVVVLIAALGVACGQGHPPAQDGEKVVTGAVQTDDVLLAGRIVRIESEVRADVTAAAQDVVIAAPVSGYVMGAGRTVTVEQPVGNDLWAAGEQVRVASDIGNNAMVAGRTVHLDPGSSIGKDARIAGSEIRSEAAIDGNLTIGAATAEIGGEVGGTVQAHAGRVTVLPGAVVHGDLVVESPRPPEIAPDAQVLGAVRHEPTREESAWSAWPLFWLWTFLALLLLGAAALAFGPAWTPRVADVLRRRTAMSLLSGLVLLVAVPLAAVLLLITMIGVPLAIVLMALYVTALVLSGVFVSYRVGAWLLERGHRPAASRWAALALGALIVSLGLSLPVVGWLVALVVLVMGAGALAVDWGGTVRGWRSAGAV